MGGSFKFGRIFGIDIKVHFTFLFILIWGALNYGGSAGPLYGILVTLALFSLVLLHELGHSLAAMAYGIPVKDITLLPIGGVARLERMPKQPIRELVVALAGPFVNVVLALLLLPIILLLFPGTFGTFSFRLLTEPGLLGLLAFMLSANISLAVFNMLPAFPLDGGRVLRATLGFFTSAHRATKIAVTIGQILAFGLIGLAIYSQYTFGASQFILILIGIFILLAGRQEGQAADIRNKLNRLQAGQILKSNRITLSPDATVGQIASLVLSGQQADFAIVDAINGDLLGITNGKTIAQALAEGHWYRRITEVMQHAPTIPTVHPSMPLGDVQEKLTEKSKRVAAVYDGINFRGLISLDDIYLAFNMMPKNGGFAQQQI
ncbi:MAG: site-2 protease family protein [Chloroflexota bacterium]